MRTLAATERLAIFDLDRTLIPGSSLVPLARQLARRGLVDRARLVGAVARNAAFARRGADASTAERVTADALAAVTGLDAGVLAEVVLDAACDVVRTFRPAIHRLARQHAAMGETCVIVSAAPHELVQHVARLGDFDLGIGTRVEVRDGMLTGRLDGPFCHGVGKLARLRDELAWADLRRATVYSDAGSDLPLLEACGFPVAVRPDRVLRAVARRSGWPVVAH
jgi:HAD superfamily hydrolase (TIGR01490 family)